MKRPFAVSVTYPTRESAEESSCELVRRRLAACCQISEITSIYFWKEAIVKETEYKLIAKTFSSLFAGIQEFVAGSHPYEVPEITGMEMHLASRQYLEWMNSCVDDTGQAPNTRQ
ncbi:similarity to E. COLI PERIPLASMIC DIVALENT CATION TOLERANCE PROTEIN CUTA [Encephalitozoon cuniculi GB-M1]|uniref:Probable divalent-cation tolerance protein cutA homolog n=1 Tax=Encephalitozoon cuniculi (strain GB-M1) TaxID=284813 RepID=CUTA_ENCCU|nr:uncharacterized protein ECU04_1360 [Encephalitozoon cuniculi GB-M1]Q8SVR6.1 RecName: Full=Probable divalent-cation tolerance protein cutA homolog [Encephalitozoon cuniculi GB-M1]CAD25325.1 similarity to E. COLI PERIPLASMIC DIVALENT CATION TOLERANCE PROTEIN CUTA [Encephalitozoon cuniculi GB-M1]